MLRRLSVRGKILATLAIPVIVLVIAAVIIAGQSISTAVTGGQSKAIAEATRSHDALLTALQNEYSVTLDNATSGADGLDAIKKARTATDVASSAYLAQAEPINLGVYTDDVQSSWSTAASSVRGLADSRAAVDEAIKDSATISPFPAVNATYSKIVSTQSTFYQTLTNALSDRTLAQSFNLYTQTFTLRSDYANEVRVATPVLTQGGSAGAADATTSISAVQATNAGIAAVDSSLDQLQLANEIEVPAFSITQSVSRSALLAARPDQATQAAVDAWPQDTVDFSAALADMQGKVRAHVADVAAKASSDAWTQAWITVGAAVLAIILSVLLALLISRQVTRPLSLLTAAAGRVRDELPKLVEQSATPGEMPDMTIEPIKLDSRDEIGQLADAFNEVNETTVSVAREQAALRGSIAEMFVNVARRDHALLNRQLSFLDDLERAEEDPTTLSNLFRLDHLATRMRRNSESLLVLAGIDSGRRVREGMPLSDVVRTASSEIEAYDRVELTLIEDPTMLGHNALNAAHLLAELLENATMFSDPSTMISVSTSSDRYYVTVSVQDHGLGMTPEELEAANRKLASRTASEVVGSQRLGLFVVGRIADRLGAHVTFDTAEGGGTLVTTAFPRALFIGLDDFVEHDGVRAGAEPLEAEPVDLAALTDGATETGMPRRKARSAEPASAAPSVGLGADFNEDDIILPALETPLNDGAGLADPRDDDTWQPLEITNDAIGAGLAARRADGGLPSRTPSNAPAISLDTPEIGAPVDSETRSAMFSSFRARDALIPVVHVGEDSVGVEPEVEPEPEPLVVPGLAPDGDEPWAASTGWSEASTATDVIAQPEPVLAPPPPAAAPETADEVPAEDSMWAAPTPEAFAEPAAPAEPEPVAVPEVSVVAPGDDLGGLDFVPVETSQDMGDRAAPAGDLAARERAPRPEVMRRLPRHASPEVIERLSREIEMPQDDATAPGIGAEPTDSVLADSSFQDSGFQDSGFADSGFQDSLAPVELDEPTEPAVDAEVPWQVPGLTDDDDALNDIAPAADDVLTDDVLVDDVTVDETDSVQPAAAGTDETQLAGLVPADADAPLPAVQELADEPAPGAELPAADQIPAAVSAGLVSSGATAAAVPSFADVIADAPEATEQPAKKGLLGRLFGGGKEKAEPKQKPEPKPKQKQKPERQSKAERKALQAQSAEAEAAAVAPVVFAPPSDLVAPAAPEQPITDGFAAPPLAPGEGFAPVADAPPSFAPAGSAAQDAEGEHPIGVSSFGPDGEPTMTAYAQVYPDADTEAALQSASTQEPWTPQAAFEPAPWSADPAPSGAQSGLAPRRGSEPAPQPAAPSAWNPGGPAGDAGTSGSMSSELAAMLASRADIQEQALSELSQLSTYRPAAVQDQPADGLVRRQRGEVAAPADDPTSQKISRDASVLRSRLSAFQSGTSRGRQEVVEADDGSTDRDAAPDEAASSTV